MSAIPKFAFAALLACGAAGYGFAEQDADALALVTGEFPPYTGAALPQGGISAVLVREAFLAAGQPAPSIVFLPWKRAYSETEQGRFAASFPYARDENREKAFLYSEPLHQDRFSYFARQDDEDARKGRWQGKRLCLPLGWTTAYVDADVRKYQLRLERPPTLENCLKMLNSDTVDLVSCNDFVADYAMRRLFGPHAPFAIADIGKAQSSELYLIVSRRRPDAERLIRQFNQGLAALRDSGRYQLLLRQYREQPASR
ncbi:substrate-binding periplasmic protein [Chromobacterium subtsugae]|uniref:substrate-binding periplasmic protein n=1 Tax=Chromobacterium subtsugae TaxID=251747 RepID=UPI00069A445F|nr:transporter substrate-binding domain-containing protein [Chromobacterium subtsugae]